MDANRTVALAQSALYVGTGVWPLVHMRSFEAVTGPKRDKWLVKTVGVLVTAIGATLGLAAARRRFSSETRALGALSAAALAAIDFVYVGKRRISPVYALDGVAELALACGWLAGARRS